MMTAARHRLRQGLAALFAWARPVDDATAQAILPPSLYTLYQHMPRRDRQHALEVLDGVRHQCVGSAISPIPPALCIAALLHDVGKVRAPFYLWERVGVVLAEAALPAAASRWGAHPGEPMRSGWYRPFMVRTQHPAWGAVLAAQAGADPLTVELIARHADKLSGPPRTEADHLLLVLQAADNE